jgi:hypothetical protein
MTASNSSRPAALSRAVVTICLLGSSFLATAEVPVLHELADLHDRTGLTLAYVTNSQIFDVSFNSRNFQLLQKYNPDVSFRSGRLSPDGTKIAFSYSGPPGSSPGDQRGASPSESREILGIMLSNGSGLRTYETIRNPQSFCWSPDQEFLTLTGILTSGKDREEVSGVLLLVPDSGAVRLIARAGIANSPCWSQDGSKLVYESDNKMYIWTVKDNGTRPVPASGKWPTWSPIDDSITFYEAGGYRSFDPRTGSAKRLFSAKDTYSPLWWSPDGRFTAYVSGKRFSESTLGSEYPDEVRLRVRRTVDGQEDWVVRFSRIGPWQDFQWVRTLPLVTGSSK